MTKEHAEAQMHAMYHAMRPALLSHATIFSRPRDILAHRNPHLQ